MTMIADYPGLTLRLVRFQLMWVTVIVVSAASLTAQTTSVAPIRSQPQGGSVSVQDLASKDSLSQQRIFEDIAALAKARREFDSLRSLNQLLVSGGWSAGMPEPEDLRSNISAAGMRVHELEDELQKAITRASIDSAVRSLNQLMSPMEKLKTTADFQGALKRPSKRADAIRALAAMIEHAINDRERTDFRRLVSAVEAAPVGSTAFVDFLLEAQHSDALTGACASVVLSQVSLSAKQSEQMLGGLSEQRRTTSTDPVIQHLLDLASQIVSTSQRGLKSIDRERSKWFPKTARQSPAESQLKIGSWLRGRAMHRTRFCYRFGWNWDQLSDESGVSHNNTRFGQPLQSLLISSLVVVWVPFRTKCDPQG